MSDIKEQLRQLIKEHGYDNVLAMMNEPELKEIMKPTEPLHVSPMTPMSPMEYKEVPYTPDTPQVASKITGFGIPSEYETASFDSLDVEQPFEHYGRHDYNVHGKRDTSRYEHIYSEEDYIFGTRVLLESVEREMNTRRYRGIKRPKSIELPLKILSSISKGNIYKEVSSKDNDLNSSANKTQIFINRYLTKSPKVVEGDELGYIMLSEFDDVVNKTFNIFDEQTYKRLKVRQDVSYIFEPANTTIEEFRIACTYIQVLIKLLKMDLRQYRTTKIKEEENKVKYDILCAKPLMFSEVELTHIVDTCRRLLGFSCPTTVNKDELLTRLTHALSFRSVAKWSLDRKQVTYDFTTILNVYRELSSVIDSGYEVYRRRALILMLHKFLDDEFLYTEGNAVMVSEDIYQQSDLHSLASDLIEKITGVVHKTY